MRQRDSVWQTLAARGDFAVNTWAVIGSTQYDTITAPVISGGLLSGDKLSVGNCISSTLKFTVMTTDAIPKSAKVVIWSQLTDGLENGLVSQPMQMGTFWINRRTVRDDLIDLECYDAMMAGNQPYVDNSVGMNWPKPMKTVVERCAEQMNVQIDSRTEIHPSVSSDVPYFIPDEEYTEDNSKLVVTFSSTTTYKLFAYSSGGDVEIDWGDGTKEALRNTQGGTINTHEYSSGTYTITLIPSGSAVVRFYKGSWRADANIDNNLKELYIGNKSQIYTNAFTQSYQLEKVMIASGVNPTIEPEAFCYNSILKSIVLPATITNIKNYVFEYCPALEAVYLQSNTPPTLTGTSIFTSSAKARFYVPYNSVNTYKSAWSSTYNTKVIGYYGREQYGDYVVTKPDDKDTLLDILRRIGEIHGGNWVITPENKLRLVPLVPLPTDTFYIVDNNFTHIGTDDGHTLIWQTNSGETIVNPAGGELINVPVVIGGIETATSYTVSKITMTVAPKDNQPETAYIAGNDTGYNLIIERNPYATQNLCDALYAQLNGITYAPFNVTNACFDPCVEYGDWVIVTDKVRSVLYNQTQRYDINYRSDISAPGKDEVEDEFPFMTPTQRMQYEIVGLQNDNVVVKSEIKQTQDEIMLKVSAGEVESIIDQKADSIRLKADKISWESDYSSMTEDGELTSKSLTAEEYLYVDGNSNSYFNIPLYYGYFRISDGGVMLQTYGPNHTPSASATGYCYVKFGTNTAYHDQGFDSVFPIDLTDATGAHLGLSGGYILQYYPSNGDYTQIYPGSIAVSDQYGNGYYSSTVQVDCDAIIGEDLRVYGTKSRVVQTEEYAKRLLYCYETASPLFGDVGEGTINDDGKCYIWFDPVFIDTISNYVYHVFVQPYNGGVINSIERHTNYFVVSGTPNTVFSWEMKAKQKEYEQIRLENADKPYRIESTNYGEDAAKHIDDIRKEREIA